MTKIDTPEQYNALVEMYKSEAFGVYLRLINDTIQVEYEKMVKGGATGEQLLGLSGKIQGLTKAKNLVFDVIKENEGRFDDKSN